MSSDVPIDLITLTRAHAEGIGESMQWMISHFKFENDQTGLEQGPSPELQDAEKAFADLRRKLGY